MSQPKKYFAEVIESSLTGWMGQSWDWNVTPQFGSFVSIDEKQRSLFGIVHQIQIGSMDPIRYPFPYQKTEKELLEEQPQIFEFLKTTFLCAIIGYQERGSIHYLVAPEPPKIHSFITYPSPEITKIFFANTHYLHLLFTHSSHIFNLDELILALIKRHNSLKLISKNQLNAFINTYALLTGNDYRRIKLFLQRVERITDCT
jgi:hypothetical protein